MTGKQRLGVAISALSSVIIVVVALYFIIRYRQPDTSVSLTGVVLEQDKDPQKQAPVAFANLTASAHDQVVRAKTDPSGLFHLRVPGNGQKILSVALKIEANGYNARELKVSNPGDLQVFYLQALPRAAAMPAGMSLTAVSNVRVRYSEKATSLVNISSIVKTFEVVNKANVPCNAGPVCSPDGKWKATIGSATIEGQGNEFRNVRVSCIAGPCPFTRRESDLPTSGARNLTVSVRNWSDTATFLVEAEVSQQQVIDMVRESYPALFGNGMTFTLPATAEGLSIEAEMNGGGTIVYPLGPDLLLSWAVCTEKTGADGTKLYRCDLKPGYEFKKGG